MNIFTKIKKIFTPSAGKRIISARYDAASRSADSMAQFAGSDYLSPDQSASPEVRRLIASRARNEFANNSYAYGIVSTLAGDTIGNGPRLQITAHTATPYCEEHQRRERRFTEFTKKIRLAAKLRLARIAKAVDGETFLVISQTGDTSAPLDITLHEPEQVTSDPLTITPTEYHSTGEPVELDGITYNRFGKPVKYRFQRIHPGEALGNPADTYELPASSVLHYANIIRGGQHRGISEMLAALHVFNDLRRYSTAVLASAETAASISFIVSNDLPADYYAPPEKISEGEFETRLASEGTSTFKFGRSTGLALPDGYKATQLHAEQPTQTYTAFKDAKINEAARVFSMPFNVAAGNSSSYNYASGRLDHQVYHRTIAIEREEIENIIMTPLYNAWQQYDAATHPEDYTGNEETTIRWMWSGFDHVDPTKEAAAMLTRLSTGITTLEEECAKEGKDFAVMLQQRAREYQMAQELNLQPPAWLTNPQIQNQQTNQENEE